MDLGRGYRVRRMCFILFFWALLTRKRQSFRIEFPTAWIPIQYFVRVS